MISRELEIFLMLISSEKRKRVLFLGEEQSFQGLAEKFDVCFFENNSRLSCTSRNNAHSYDLIVCLDPMASKSFSSRGIYKALNQRLNAGGKLIIGFEGRRLSTLANLARLKREASKKYFKSIRLYIAYPSVKEPLQTCRCEKESLIFFYENLRSKPSNRFKRFFYKNLMKLGLLFIFAPGYIVEIEK